MCELLHTSAVVQKMQGALSFWANRSSFLIGEFLLGKLSEAVVVVGNAPHDRPGFLVGHLIGNRASFLCTKAPMLRVPETNFLQGITSFDKGQSTSDGPGCGHQYDRGCEHQTQQTEQEHMLAHVGALSTKPKVEAGKSDKLAS